MKKFPPSVIALLLQAAAFAALLLFARAATIQVSPLLFALLCGALAALFSRMAGLARWWLFIQFLFAPALVLMLALNIPPGFFLAAFLIMLAVYWSTFRTQVPLYLSSREAWQALETLLPAPTGAEEGSLRSSGEPTGVPLAGGGAGGEGKTCEQGANYSKHSLTLALSRGEREHGFTFMDIGSGIGGVLTHLAKARPDGRYFGVETAPLPFLLSWLRIRLGGYRNCQVQWGSLWSCNLAPYDVVFAYLSPVPMDQLWHKAKSEMRSGTLFISNTFAVSDHPPQDIITLDDLHHSTLYIWRL